MSFRSKPTAWIAAAALSLTACGGSDVQPPDTITTDRTSSLEAARVDSVKTAFVPGSCGDFPPPETPHDCGTVTVPLDYDQPNGATVELTVYRLRSAKPDLKLGTLFFNPGGPGFRASAHALYMQQGELDPRILDRYDIVGVDPRGTGDNLTNQVRCYQSMADKSSAWSNNPPYPLGAEEEAKAMQLARDFAHQCATVGMPLAGAASTAQVARDMDVVRRVLGIERLNMIGISYGSYLGAVYANLFPDRVGAIVLHAAIDPVATVSSLDSRGQRVPPEVGQDMAGGVQLALTEFLRLCDQAGAPACAFAGSGDSMAKWRQTMERLKERPVTMTDDFGDTVQVTQASMAGTVQNLLGSMNYVPESMDQLLAQYLQDVFALTEPTTTSAEAHKHASSVARMQASRPNGPLGRDSLDYSPTIDTYYAVSCSDSDYPQEVSQWPAFAEAEDRRVPYFGRLFAWNSSACAASMWGALDEDAYKGPFNRRTASTILVVGNYYDPSTPYSGAVAAARNLGNARLLSSDSWGHGAHDLACVKDAVVDYMLTGTLPAEGTVCVGPQPFSTPAATGSVSEQGSARSLRRASVNWTRQSLSH